MDWLFWWIHGFRMPLFFLVAGFFAALLSSVRGLQGFLVHRTRRVLVPFVVGSVTVLPLLYLVWSFGWLREGRCTTRNILRVEFSDEIQRNLIGPAHLWFLEDLLLLSLAFAVVARLRPAFGAGVGALLASPWRRFLLALPTAAILAIDLGPAIELRNSFLPDPFRLLHYGVFFLAGASLHRFRDDLDRFADGSGTCLLLSLPIFLFLAASMSSIETLSHAERLSLALACALFAWLSVFGFLGLFLRCCSGPRPAIRYLSDASYWIYLCHLPVVGLLQIGFAGLELPAAAKFASVTSLAMLVGLATYRAFVRYTIIGAFLNGPRERRSDRYEAALIPPV
jgi:peptidoglycan/LPS O-acetylase OafA/YrhL